MKKLLTTVLSAALLAAPMGASSVAMAHDNGRGHDKHHGHGHDKHDGWKESHRDWRKGDRLPVYYRDRYAVVDYRTHGFREPPRGYHYVRDDSGKYLLVGIATGVVLGVILAGN